MRPLAMTSLWGREAYPTLDEKAAVLLESLVRNRSLVDGNKRLGWLATVVFLDINGVWVEAPDDEYDPGIAPGAEENCCSDRIMELLVRRARELTTDS